MSQKETNFTQSRRNFLKKGIAGIAGAALLPPLMNGETTSPLPNKPQNIKNPKMIYRTLGKTGIKVPIVSMGVMNADNPNLVKAALDSGINFLDTAWYYQAGRNEEMIGQVVKNRPRDSFYIATKVWEPRDRSTDLFPPDAKEDTFIQKFETSLKRLGLDYVDILYLHSISRKESVTFEPYLNALKKFKKEGKVRFIGVTTHRNEPEVIQATIDSKEYDVILTAYNFKQPYHADVKKAIDNAAKAGLGVVAMKTQAGVYWDDKTRKYPIDMKAALKWALQNENVHTAIPGFTTFDQLELDLSVMEDLSLTDQEKANLNPPAEIKTLAGLYCQQCGTCTKQCPTPFDIPNLMRGYMYAYGYRNLEQARITLDAENLANIPCKNCNTCKINCSMGFDIKNRILDITRLKDVPMEFLG